MLKNFIEQPTSIAQFFNLIDKDQYCMGFDIDYIGHATTFLVARRDKNFEYFFADSLNSQHYTCSIPTLVTNKIIEFTNNPTLFENALIRLISRSINSLAQKLSKSNKYYINEYVEIITNNERLLGNDLYKNIYKKQIDDVLKKI